MGKYVRRDNCIFVYKIETIVKIFDRRDANLNILNYERVSFVFFFIYSVFNIWKNRKLCHACVAFCTSARCVVCEILCELKFLIRNFFYRFLFLAIKNIAKASDYGCLVIQVSLTLNNFHQGYYEPSFYAIICNLCT